MRMKSEVQAKILTYYKDYWATNRCSPSVGDVVQIVGRTRSTVYHHILQLELLGELVPLPGRRGWYPKNLTVSIAPEENNES